MEYSPVAYGPDLANTLITAGLDYYKPTMSQLAYNLQPDTEVTFTFKNRGQQRIADFVKIDDLVDRFEAIQQHGFQSEEIDYLASLTDSQNQRIFNDLYLLSLHGENLPDVKVEYDYDIQDIAINTTGKWSMVTFWETVIMSQVNELYFEGYIRANNIDPLDLYAEGDRRLSEKITYFQANPDIKFADFGTRRHFSAKWHEHVIERLASECPDNFLGTSNVYLANKLNLKPIGTFAHEMPMVYAGLADSKGQDIRASHAEMLDDWFDTYGDDLSIALSDTFGSDSFFEDFGETRAKQWHGTRQDSGDPLEYGQKVIKFYQDYGIEPRDKLVIFSDSLDTDRVDKIHRRFAGKIGHIFGIGTFLTNDLGPTALNIVMKATNVDGFDTVKLSDDPGKHTGPDEKVAQYQTIFTKQGVLL